MPHHRVQCHSAVLCCVLHCIALKSCMEPPCPVTRRPSLCSDCRFDILAVSPQALLEAISLSQPQPKVPSELIRFLGKTFCAWHTGIPLLESHVMLFPNDPRCFDALVRFVEVPVRRVAGLEDFQLQPECRANLPIR